MRRIAAVGLLVALSGCASAAKTVATAQNSYDWYESVYEERCVIATPPAECTAAVSDLHVFEKHLHLAAKAIRAGGGLPLQLNALHADEKALAKRAVLK